MHTSGSAGTITYVVELCVGLSCVVGAAGAWRRPGLRLFAACFIAAGLAAVLHAVVSLA